jgi:hypothetical protein
VGVNGAPLLLPRFGDLLVVVAECGWQRNSASSEHLFGVGDAEPSKYPRGIRAAIAIAAMPSPTSDIASPNARSTSEERSSPTG